jgi:anti-sigma B factor antagonist
MSTNADEPAGPPGTLTLRLDHLRAGVPGVHASGCLDRTTAPDLQHVLDDQLAAAPWAIVIDLSAVSVLEPTAVPTLVQIAYRAGEADIGVCLVTADSAVKGALATMGVEKLFEIHSTTEAALRALS